MGVENLGIKYTSSELKDIFKYMDKENKGNIDYRMFCSLCEERRRDIDPFSNQVKENQKVKSAS